MSKDLFDLANLFIKEDLFGWDRDSYRFNRAQKDMHPYSMLHTEDGILIIHNILGIEKEDLNVAIKAESGTPYINIKGETEDKISKQKYSINSRFAIDATRLDVAKAKVTMKNGLLYIEIPYKIEKDLIEETQLKIN